MSEPTSEPTSEPAPETAGASTDAPGRLSLRSFWQSLSPDARWLLSPVVVQTLGRGLTLPFTLIYLHEVRGIGLDVAGALMGLLAAAGFVTGLPGGWLTDRLGARALLMASTVAHVLGTTMVAFATTVPQFVVALALVGAGWGVAWPAYNAMIAAVTDGPVRQQFFGVNFALVNLGIGLGGVVGALFVDVARPLTFTAIFLGDALLMLAPLVVLLVPLRHVSGRAEPAADAEASEHPSTYLGILRRPGVGWVLALTFVSTFVGYGQIEAGMPAFAWEVGQVSTRALGLSLTANTAAIVLLQFSVLGRITGRRRTRVLVVMAGIWSAGWLLLGSIAGAPGTVMAAATVVSFGVVFALGETLLQPTIPALTNALAADHLRGRYNALGGMAFQAGAITAPVVAGVLLDRELYTAYITMLVVGCGLLAVMALAVERRLSPEVNGLEPPGAAPDPLDHSATPGPDAVPAAPGSASAG